jgi:hypothetical protein
MSNPNLGKVGKRFGEGQDPTLGGRKKSYVNQVWELMGITKDEDKIILMSKEDKYKFIQNLFDMPLEELEKLANNTKLPVFVVTVIRALIADIADGKTFTMQQFFDRFYGKAHQSMELSGDAQQPVVHVIAIQPKDITSDKIE